MAQYLRSINAPALLRALADVMEHNPHVMPSLTAGSRNEVDFDFGRKSAWERIVPVALVVSFSAEIKIQQHAFSHALGAAYKRHGGDPSSFLTKPQLAQLEAQP